MGKLTKEETLAVESGRRYLAQWLKAAESNGTIYYAIPSVSRSGMSRQIQLAKLGWEVKRGEDARPTIERLWPAFDDAYKGDHSRGLDAVAKDWRFSFKHRAFIIGGCGMDMVFALVDDLAGTAGLPRNYANRVRREIIF